MKMDKAKRDMRKAKKEKREKAKRKMERDQEATHRENLVKQSKFHKHQVRTRIVIKKISAMYSNMVGAYLYPDIVASWNRDVQGYVEELDDHILSMRKLSNEIVG